MKSQLKQKKIAVVCGALLSLSITQAAFAQSNPSTLIVTGTRFEENLNEVPANVKVITRDEIENSTSNTSSRSYLLNWRVKSKRLKFKCLESGCIS